MIYKTRYINKLGVGLLIVSISGGLFYWFQLRPAQIKHDCSWVRHYDPGKSAEPAMTENQLWEKGLLKDCSGLTDKSGGSTWVSRLNLFGKDYCESENKKKIEEYKNGKPAVPPKEWWEPADEDEYRFCLHDKGL